MEDDWGKLEDQRWKTDGNAPNANGTRRRYWLFAIALSPTRRAQLHTLAESWME
jgi:hypothetical protein